MSSLWKIFFHVERYYWYTCRLRYTKDLLYIVCQFLGNGHVVQPKPSVPAIFFSRVHTFLSQKACPSIVSTRLLNENKLTRLEREQLDFSLLGSLFFVPTGFEAFSFFILIATILYLSIHREQFSFPELSRMVQRDINRHFDLTAFFVHSAYHFTAVSRFACTKDNTIKEKISLHFRFWSVSLFRENPAKTVIF